eukprot:507751_1
MNKELETRSIECEKMNQRSSGFDEKMETLKEKMYFAIGLHAMLKLVLLFIFNVLFLTNELNMLIACVWCACCGSLSYTDINTKSKLIPYTNIAPKKRKQLKAVTDKRSHAAILYNFLVDNAFSNDPPSITRTT